MATGPKYNERKTQYKLEHTVTEYITLFF